jgi:hypothetical protein
MQTATHAQRQASIISALPSWVPRVNLTVPDNLNQQYRFTFDCPCGKRPRITARIPKAGASHQEMLSLLLKSLDDSQHGSCGQHHAAYPRPESEQDAAKTESLQKENKRLATKKRQLDSEVEVLTAKNKKAAAATTAQADLKRRATLAEQRRLDIDRENKETLIIRNKGTALTTPGSANPGGLTESWRLRGHLWTMSMNLSLGSKRALATARSELMLCCRENGIAGAQHVSTLCLGQAA